MDSAQNRKAINSPTEIPDFENEEREREFWRSHTFGPGMLDRALASEAAAPPPGAQDRRKRIRARRIQQLRGLSSDERTMLRIRARERTPRVSVNRILSEIEAGHPEKLRS